MKKRFFGARPEGASDEDAEREAAAELNRLTRQARPPSQAAPSGYKNLTGGRPAPQSVPRGPSAGPRPLPVPSFVDPDDDDEDSDQPFSIKAEEEAVTELALRDWAAQGRGSGNFQDYALVGVDRMGAEAQRDRALREALERQQRLQKEYQARRAEALRGGTPFAQPARPVANANFGRPNITYATSAPGASRVNVARQDAINAAGKERARRAAVPKPEGPPMTPAARRAKATEAAAAKKTAAAKKAPAAKKTAAAKKAPAAKKTAAAKKAPVVKKAPVMKKAPAPEPPRLLTPAARRALAAEQAAAESKAAAASRARKPPPPAPKPPPPPEPPRLLTPAARRALAAEQAAAEAAARAAPPKKAAPTRRAPRAGS